MEERIKTLTHEAAHYQMLTAQQRMIIQSLEDTVKTENIKFNILLSERNSDGVHKQREEVNKLINEKDVELNNLCSDLRIERDLVKTLENQLELIRADSSENARLLSERRDALQVRDETIQQLRCTMRQRSYSSEKDTKKRTDKNEGPSPGMEETRQHLMQMQLSKESLSNELEQARQDLAKRDSDIDNLRLELEAVEEEVQNGNESFANLREDFIRTQEALVSKTEEVRYLNEQLLDVRFQASRDLADVRRELANKITEFDEVHSELEDTKSQLQENQKLLTESPQPCSKDWIIERGEVTVTERVLGVGAWGNVKVGKFRGTEVALKQIHLLILSPHNRRLFEREMTIASRCRHPCLVQFIGATNDDGTPLFIMELLETDLRHLLSQQTLNNGECLQIAFDVIRALSYLHQSKPVAIIHRDISSSNVLLYRGKNSWRAKLSDYGAANFMRLSMTRHPGALLYSAPEASTMEQTSKVISLSIVSIYCYYNFYIQACAIIFEWNFRLFSLFFSHFSFLLYWVKNVLLNSFFQTRTYNN